MKNTLIILILILSTTAFGQNKDKREKIKALKIAFITERLDLSETEAQKFWPIYNTYETEKDRQRRIVYEKRQQISDDMTEAEAQIILKDLIKFERDREGFRLNYIESLINVLPAKKIINLRTVEDEFNRKMLEEYKKRHGDPHKSNN